MSSDGSDRVAAAPERDADRGRDGRRGRARERRAGGASTAGPGGRRGAPLARAGRSGSLARWLLASPLALALEAVVLVALALVLFLVLSQGREMPLPQALSDRIEARAEAALGSVGQAAALDLGRIAVVVEEGGGLRLRAEDVRLGAAEGAGGVTVPALEAALGPGSLLRPGRAPRTLVLRGAALDVTRRVDGQLDFGFGTLPLLRRTPAEAIARIRGLLAREAMAPLQSLRLEGLGLTFRDARSGRVWQFDDATLSVARAGGEIAVALDADLPGRVSLRLTVPEAGPPTARLSALVDGVPAADLAAQAPALGWLAPLEAPVSGALIGRLGVAGALGPVDGTLEIGPGRLAPDAGRPLPFDRAQAYFSYRPEGGRLTFTSLAVEAPGLSLSASGHADLAGPAGEWPDALTAQLMIEAGEIRDGAALPGPLRLADGAIDAKITLAPFAAEIGQAGVTVATGGGAAAAEATPASLPADPGAPGLRLMARGRVAAEAGGWAASLDLGAEEAGPAQVLALWPLGAAPGTRDWVARNVLSGRIERPRAGLRLSPGERPRLAVTFGFREGRVRPLRGFPPVEGGRGRAALGENRFSVSLEAGRIAPEGERPVDLAGTSFVIADTRLQPADGDLRLAASGPVPSALALLDLPQEAVSVLEEYPTKIWEQAVPTDPCIYRLYEIVGVYGPTMKALIQEEFGDGIMSAIDFDMKITRVANPKGDRVKVEMSGKFLGYNAW